MKCRQVENFMAPYIDNEVLKPRQRRKINEHLEICLRCQELEKDFRKILGLRGKIKKEPMPADFKKKLNNLFINSNI